MEARNRKIEDWFGKLKRGEIKLPRFQRFEAWDRKRITSLTNTIVQNLPLGITLILEVGEKEQFISRYLATAPETKGRVLEQLLDGQQRLTALWRVLFNNYDWESYYLYFPQYDEIKYLDNEVKEETIHFITRYMKKNQKYPLWCDEPEECLKRGMVPTNLLKPEDIQTEIDSWLSEATLNKKPSEPDKLENYFTWKKGISDRINNIRSIIKNYNLPYLSLPTDTPKDTALEVFINMNTNSKPLSVYDIIVAEVESIKQQSLHDLQDHLDSKYPDVKYYGDLSSLILYTSALLQEKLPNQRGSWDMDKSVMVDNWEKMEKGLDDMAKFLFNEGVYDKDRLPTNAVLAVIAALYPFIPEKGDERGVCELLLKKYLWTAFFTDRYENSAATHAYYDYLNLKKVILKENNEKGIAYKEEDIPIFNKLNYHIAEADELLNAAWSKRDTIRGKAILAIACNLGAYDFATGLKVDRSNIVNRHYHHIYPDALLVEAEIESYLALNCALISDNTNLKIGRKDPLVYLKDRYKWVSEKVVNERLNSHLIPIKELANGGYENITDDSIRKDKIKKDFDLFLKKRAEYFAKAAKLLCEGNHISTTDIIV